MSAAFDPFTATLEEAQAQPDADEVRGAVDRWYFANAITARREYLEAHPIDGVAQCVRHDLIAPDWLAVAFLRQYDKVLNCRVGSWDAAFGSPFPPRTRLETQRLRRVKTWALASFFNAPGAPPRTDEGWAAAALALGITARQAEEWAPKTRKNSRGHKPYGWAREASAASAHDPFGMAPKRRKPG